MQIKQDFTVDHPRAAVWDFFGQVEEVTQCMPGASLTEPPRGEQVKFKLAVKLGPMRAAFSGDSQVERDDASCRGVIRGSGTDRRTGSRAKGELEYRLSEAEDGAATRVDIALDFSLAGKLAQFSRGSIVTDVARRLTAEFARNLQASLDALGPGQAPATEAGAPAPVAEPQPPAEPPPATELDAGSVLWTVLWGRVKAFFGRLFSRS